ncbi:PRC-barrel domain-containing protein [Mycetocola sp. 2940]|uniref:PRC-barrel domain-containing protein n=1 Tax=Mycetocola sp. 2940 TaxID=3156452 RepID=UPI003395EDED
MLDSRDIGGLQGAPVIGRDNEKLGTVGQVFLDSQTGAPNWVTVKTGLFGHKETFIPLADARWDGEEVHVDIDRETVKEAPRIDTDEALSPHNEEALYRYYGLSDRDTDGGTARPDEYPDRDYSIGPDGQTVTPIPTGTTDADREGLRDRDRLRNPDRDTDRDGVSDVNERTDTRADTAAPRDLADLHPEENRYDSPDPHDLRMSEQPLGDPAPAGGLDAQEHPGKHSRMRRFDPAVDGVEGQRVDRNDPPRTL